MALSRGEGTIQYPGLGRQIRGGFPTALRRPRESSKTDLRRERSSKRLTLNAQIRRSKYTKRNSLGDSSQTFM